MTINAAPLIHSRTKHVDYRPDFLVRPDSFSPDCVKTVKKYILSTTSSISELKKDECRRAVIIEDGNIIFGITAYMDYFNQISEGLFSDLLYDGTGRRRVYLSVGLVINRSELKNPVSFPDDRCFVEVIRKYLVPRWEEYKYDEGSLKTTLAGYELPIAFDCSYGDNSSISVNCTSADEIMLFPTRYDTEVLNRVLSELSKGKILSVCTNMVDTYDAKDSLYMNATVKSLSRQTTEKRCAHGEQNEENTVTEDKHEDDNGKEQKQKTVDTEKIAITLLCIGAIIICGSYIIIVDKKTVFGILIAAGISLAALIAVIVLLKKKKSTKKPFPPVREEEFDSSFKIEIRNENTIPEQNKNSRDIFKL